MTFCQKAERAPFSEFLPWYSKNSLQKQTLILFVDKDGGWRRSERAREDLIIAIRRLTTMVSACLDTSFLCLELSLSLSLSLISLDDGFFYKKRPLFGDKERLEHLRLIYPFYIPPPPPHRQYINPRSTSNYSTLGSLGTIKNSV